LQAKQNTSETIELTALLDGKRQSLTAKIAARPSDFSDWWRKPDGGAHLGQ
jgi:hypothetical protein